MTTETSMNIASPARTTFPVYTPKVRHTAVYIPHHGRQPWLKYNHDVDIVRFKGRLVVAWNANETGLEDVPGQYNFLSVSDDFDHWTTPVRLFCPESGCENPVESDNQWQPSFINYHDEMLFCNWCDYNARRTFVATSTDGTHWRNRDVPIAPPSLAGQVVAFPTNHGLLTRDDVMFFPCSLPMAEETCWVGHTKYAGVLISRDAGQTWEWSAPIEAVSWSEMGEDPAAFGGERVYLWEPMLFEHPDGRIGLLIRNSTAQEDPERNEKPHRMLLYAESADQGRTWSKARPVELKTICSRNFAVSGAGVPSSLLMVMNDNDVRVPERISRDRYFLSLYCAPVCDPDLLLPGPVVQPDGGTAFYPNGFVEDGRMYLGFTYAGVRASLVESLPDFSRPFLLPRGGRPGLRFDGDMAVLSHRSSSLGLVLTPELTRQSRLRLAFDACLDWSDGTHVPLLTLGGITRNGAVLRACCPDGSNRDVIQVQPTGGPWVDICELRTREVRHFELNLTPHGFSVSVDGGEPRTFDTPLLRKICFGGLYEPSPWPHGANRSVSQVRVGLDSICLD